MRVRWEQSWRDSEELPRVSGGNKCACFIVRDHRVRAFDGVVIKWLAMSCVDDGHALSSYWFFVIIIVCFILYFLISFDSNYNKPIIDKTYFFIHFLFYY